VSLGLFRHLAIDTVAAGPSKLAGRPSRDVHTTNMTALVDRLLGLWQEPVDERDDPEAAFRELYADPVSINGTPMPVSSLVERARALQRAFDGRTTEIVDLVETPDRVAIAFYMRARHVGPLDTPVGSVTPTGSTVEIRTIDILTIADGLITGLWVVSDELGMLTQLDAVRLV
jgi:predicted ester cyclase